MVLRPRPEKKKFKSLKINKINFDSFEKKNDERRERNEINCLSVEFSLHNLVSYQLMKHGFWNVLQSLFNNPPNNIIVLN